MATNSKIQWTDVTWNPTTGCSMASEGCRFCYAVRMTKRLAAMGNDKYAGLVNLNKNHFNGVVKCHEDVLLKPFGWKKPRRVFVNSMSDLFHSEVPFDFIDKVFAVMALTPHIIYQILTKRPERMAEYLSQVDREQLHWLGTFKMLGQSHYGEKIPWPLANVWKGTSVEDQKAADERIPHLVRCPAAVRFLSCEPLIGELSLSRVATLPDTFKALNPSEPGLSKALHWVIVGGESGPKARPFALGWAKDIVCQCQAAGVPVFVKQLGSNPTNYLGEPCPNIKSRKGDDMSEWPEELRIREFPV